MRSHSKDRRAPPQKSKKVTDLNAAPANNSSFNFLGSFNTTNELIQNFNQTA